MERKLITCPESAHLEEIDMERTPHGLLIASCSRFSPPCAVTCGRECAARMDRRDRARLAANAERVLLVYADEGAHVLARELAALLDRDNFVVELADADTRGLPPPQDYDAVVVLAPVRRRRLAGPTADYVTLHREVLTAMPSFFVPISTRESDDLSAGESLAFVPSTTGWAPSHSEAIAVHARASSRRGDHLQALATKIADEIPGQSD